MRGQKEVGKLSATTLTKIMLVDDHMIMREGLQEVLERTGEYEIVGHASDGEVAVEMAQSLSPDVIIMDILMPVKDGIEACREIKDVLPATHVLILTASTEEDTVVQAVAAGATGYLQKFSGREKLISTVRDVSKGEFRMPGDVMRRVFQGIRSTSDLITSPELDRLTPREQEILKFFARGLSYSEIAGFMGNRPLTIRNAVYAIQNKLGVKTKQELVVWAVRRGLLDDFPDPE
jgi:DNA-binding NarL/FixJ family response regulator